MTRYSKSDWQSCTPKSQFHRLWLEGIGWELAEYEHRLKTAKTDADRKRFASLIEMKHREGCNVAALSDEWDQREEQRQ